MEQIVAVHFPGLRKALLKEAREVFLGPRDVPGLKKKPSTSVVFDGLMRLLAEDIPLEAMHSADRRAFIPPLDVALLQSEPDPHLFQRVALMARAGR